jgi:hypothetical protein
LKSYEAAHPAAKPGEQQPAAEAPKPADGAAQEAVKPGEAPKPAEAPAAPATPQQLAELMAKSPEFGEFMEAHPEVKGPVFAMARELASQAPIVKIFPTEGDAKFAQEYSGAMVALKSAALRTIDNPENLPAFLETFDSQFQRVDANGQPLLDNGKPVYDPDREVVIGGIFNREVKNYTDRYAAEMEQVKQRLAGHYPNEQAKAADQAHLDNLEYALTSLKVLEMVRSGEFFRPEAPQLPADATPEQKAWYEARKKELDDQERALEDKRKGASKEERTAAKAAFVAKVNEDKGSAVGGVIAETLNRAIEQGTYIPQAYLQEKYKGRDGKELNVARIVGEIYAQFEEELHRPGSKTLLEIVQHELLPENEQTRQIRKDYHARKAAEMVPALVDKEIERIKRLVKLDAEEQEKALKARRGAANVEPATGGSSLPSGATDAQIIQAAEEAAKKLPEWASADGRTRQAMILTQRHKMVRK